MVPVYHVLQRVARFDSQGLANLSWDRRLALSRYCGMLHWMFLTASLFPCFLIIPYFGLAGKPKRYCTSHSSPRFRGSMGSDHFDGCPPEDVDGMSGYSPPPRNCSSRKSRRFAQTFLFAGGRIFIFCGNPKRGQTVLLVNAITKSASAMLFMSNQDCG